MQGASFGCTTPPRSAGKSQEVTVIASRLGLDRIRLSLMFLNIENI
jgi:hypothetical protein